MIFKHLKDGGRESTVHGFWLVEWKSLLSILFLRFDGRSREAFHTHAFNSLNWVLRGRLQETMIDGEVRWHTPSAWPILTRRTDFHKVDSMADHTWVFSLRGPWRNRWREFLPAVNDFVTLTHGRRIVA